MLVLVLVVVVLVLVVVLVVVVAPPPACVLGSSWFRVTANTIPPITMTPTRAAPAMIGIIDFFGGSAAPIVNEGCTTGGGVTPGPVCAASIMAGFGVFSGFGVLRGSVAPRAIA